MAEPLTEGEEAEIAAACRCTPTWLTPEVVKDTIDVWRPSYGGKLTVDDAIEICMNAAGVPKILFPVKRVRSTDRSRRTLDKQVAKVAIQT